MKHLKTVGLAALLATAGAVAASAQTLTLGVRGGPESVDPAFSTLGTHAEALKNIFDPLVWQDEKLQLKPWLAESWRRVDDTTWEFKLKRGVKCHDGANFTSDDVKFTIDRIPGATGPQPTTAYIRNVKEFKKVDDHTFQIVTPQPSGILPYEFNRLSIVCRGAGDAKSPEMNAGKGAIGTGPFKFVSWTPKGDLVMDRFDDHWNGKAPWARHVRREISNDAARVAALLAGQVDMINYVPNQDFATLSKNNRVSVTKADSVYVFQFYLDTRENSPFVADAQGNKLDKNPMANPKVREAMDLALDRKGLVETVLEGIGSPATNTMAPGLFGERQNYPAREFNPGKARTLLAEAGYPNGFRLTMHCTNDRFPGDSAVCQAMAQMLTRVGIQTTPQAISRTVLIPAWARLEYSAVMAGWGSLTGEANFTLSLMFHTNDPSKRLGAFNRVAYSNADVDRLTIAGSQEADDAKRRAIFEDAFDRVRNDRVTLPVSVIQTIWAARANAFEFTPRADEETLAFFVRPKR